MIAIVLLVVYVGTCIIAAYLVGHIFGYNKRVEEEKENSNGYNSRVT